MLGHPITPSSYHYHHRPPLRAKHHSWTAPTVMPGNGSDNSSPVDFAFEPPSLRTDSPFDGHNTSNNNNNSNDNINTSFKIEPPRTAHTPFDSPSASFNSSNNNYSLPFSGPFSSGFGLSTGSSFSSASGSAAGGSFSSIDALPAISRDFTRPSVTETRRPATAGGALQSTSPFAGFMPGAVKTGTGEQGQRFHRTSSSEDGKPQLHDVVEENENMFTDPFSSSTFKEEGPGSAKHSSSQASQPDTPVDPRYNPMSQNRRASEPHFNVPATTAPAWQLTPSQQQLPPAFSMPSAPAHVSQMGYLQQQQMQAGSHFANYPRQSYSGRPQTSDGLPSYPALSGNTPLPSAQSIARQIPGLGDQPGFFHTSASTLNPRAHEQDTKVYMPFRDDRSASMSSLHTPQSSFPGDRAYSIDSGMMRGVGQPSNVGAIRSSYMPPVHKVDGNELTFVQLGGPTPKKRPRRRFEEIERLYSCGWNGCEKSYGTLNHLNAHVAMQKHGEKRLPSEFKEMRKAWRKKKREAAANSSNAQYMNGSWQRGSISSESDWDRRDSSSSMLSANSDFSHRSSISYAPNYTGWDGESRPGTAGSMSSADGRVYFHSTQPYPSTQSQPQGQAQAQGSYTAISGSGSGSVGPGNRRPSAPQHLPMPIHPSGSMNGFRQAEGDHPTPTAQNPFPQRSTSNAFPFNTLTSPMAGQVPPVTSTSGSNGSTHEPFGGQFAFHR